MKKLLIAYFLITLISAFSQNAKTDSIIKSLNTLKEDSNKVNTLNKLSRKFKDYNPDSSALFCEKALQLSKKIEFKKGEIHALLMLGLLEQRKGNFDLAIKIFEEALALSISTNNKIEEARTLGSIGDMYYEQQKLPEAMRNYIEALNAFEKLKIKDSRISNLYGQLGLLNFMQGNTKRSLEYLYSGLALNLKLGEPVSIGYSHIYIGNIFGDSRQFDSSNTHYLEAYKLLKNAGDKNGLNSVVANIGQNYNELGEYKKAIEYFTEAMQGCVEIQDKASEANAFINIGSAYCNLKDYNNALQQFDQAIRIATEIKSAAILKYVYRSMSYTYNEKGDHRRAYDFLLRHLEIKDSLFSEESRSQVAEMETKYQSEKKELQIKNLENEKELKAAEIKRERLLKYSGFGALGAAVIIGVLLTIGLINKRKDNKLISKQKEDVEIKNKEIENQKHILAEKNTEITDSITYAKRIQQAILPSSRLIDKALPNNFILYKPKDIVAGDFYWFEKINDLVLFAAADCTGHGVPGALVSVVCSNALNRTVLEFAITDPGKILDKTRELVIDTFNKSEEHVKDGMDISLCCLNISTLELMWAGANNPLLYIQENVLHEIKADKQPISSFDSKSDFTTHKIQLKKGDEIFIFSDGFADQFGGEKGKKFKSKQLYNTLIDIYHDDMNIQKQKLNNAFERWKGGLEQIDDVCIIGVKV